MTFTKTGALIYISNLDLYTMWERAARRADLPLAYSQGFHPQPKIHFAAPLPLGFSSRCEVLDMRLSAQLESQDVCRRLNAVLPADVRVLQAQQVDDNGPALQTQVLSADYEVSLRHPFDSDDLKRRIQSVMSATSLPRQRRGRNYDLRPLIENLDARFASHGHAMLHMRLRAEEGATGRPDEVLDALGIARTEARIERTALHFKDMQAGPVPLAR